MSSNSDTHKKSRSKGWLITALTISFVIGSGVYFLTQGLRAAKQHEQVLIDRFGYADSYTPAIDGSISADRLEAFIRVRERLQPNCLEYQSILTSIDQLNDLEDNPDVSGKDAAATGMESFKSIFTAGPKMVEFSNARNRALQDEDMGLGEYLYIYLTSYGQQLANELVHPQHNWEEASVGDRTSREFAQILTNQLQALEASKQSSDLPELAAELRAKIDALVGESQSSIWPFGPIGKSQNSLAPYQQQVASLYCSGIVKIELGQKNRGLQLEN